MEREEIYPNIYIAASNEPHPATFANHWHWLEEGDEGIRVIVEPAVYEVEYRDRTSKRFVTTHLWLDKAVSNGDRVYQAGYVLRSGGFAASRVRVIHKEQPAPVDEGYGV